MVGRVGSLSIMVSLPPVVEKGKIDILVLNGVAAAFTPLHSGLAGE